MKRVKAVGVQPNVASRATIGRVEVHELFALFATLISFQHGFPSFRAPFALAHFLLPQVHNEVRLLLKSDLRKSRLSPANWSVPRNAGFLVDPGMPSEPGT